jgi:hypothetical protein
MTPLRYWIGRTDLWVGAPLRAAVAVDQPVELDRELPSRSTALVVRSESGEKISFKSNEAEGVNAHRIFEVFLPTPELQPGPLRLAFAVETSSVAGLSNGEAQAEEITVPEDLWLLDAMTYRELLDEETGEPFEESAGLHAEEVGRLVETVLSGRIEITDTGWYPWDPSWRDDRLRDYLVREFLGRQYPMGSLFFNHESKPGQRLFPAAPVRWTTEKLIEVIEEIEVCGLVHGFVNVVAQPEDLIVGYTVELHVLTPVSEPLIASLTHKEFGRLTLLRAIAESDLEYSLEPGSDNFSLHMRLATSQFPILK